MLRLIKSLLSVIVIIIASYFRKGKLIYLLLPCMVILSFAGGFALSRHFDNQVANNKITSDAYNFDPDLLRDDLNVSYLGVNFNYAPSISKDAQYIAFSEVQMNLNKIKDITVRLYDAKNRKYVNLPGLHSNKGWDFAPSISGDGNLIAFQSNRNGSTRWDIYLYDIKAKKLICPDKLNSIFPDFNPSISPDGRYITFNSVRTLIPRVYVYDLENKKVSPLFED